MVNQSVIYILECHISFFCLFVAQAEYDKLVPGSKIQKAVGEAERLSESLRERYAAPQGKRQKLDGVDQSQGEGVGDQQVPNDSKDGDDQPKSAADVYRQSNVSCVALCVTCLCSVTKCMCATLVLNYQVRTRV